MERTYISALDLNNLKKIQTPPTNKTKYSNDCY